MKNTKLTLMAAALAVTGLTAVANAQVTDTTPAQNSADRAANNAGQALDNAGRAVKNAGNAAANGVNNAADNAQGAANGATNRADNGAPANADQNENALGVLQTSTQAALTEDGFDDLVERFVDADRNRIGASMPTADQIDKLNKLTAEIRSDWQKKYGGEFEIKDRTAVFNNSYAVKYGEVGQGSARTAGQQMTPGGESPVNPPQPNGVMGGQMNGGATPSDRAGTTTPPPPAQNPNANREPGRDIATITVPKQGDLNSIKVPLIWEFPGVYKIDVPDSVDGKKLYDSLYANLQAVKDGEAQWPANEQDAFRAVSHRVIRAVMDAGTSSK